MTHDSPEFSAPDLFEGLKQADQTAVKLIVENCEKPILQAITMAGGSHADGKVFFQTALVELCQLENLDPETTLCQSAEQLALAQFADWKQERGQMPEAEIKLPLDWKPNSDHLKQTRWQIYAWKQWVKLPPQGQEWMRLHLGSGNKAEEIAAQSGLSLSLVQTKLGLYLKSFLTDLKLKETEEWPNWLVAAMQSEAPLKVWQMLRKEENDRSDQSSGGKTSKTLRYLMAALIVLTVLVVAYQKWSEPQMPKEIFQENFQPPKSLLHDARTRNKDAPVDEEVETVDKSACLPMLESADAAYQKGNFQEAQDPLLLIALDENSACQSDAWFYLGIIRLLQHDPGTGLECFAKIDDLEHFGEDIYWYQALCFIKLAEGDPEMVPKAERAVARFVSNTRDPERKAIAEKMLKNLTR